MTINYSHRISEFPILTSLTGEEEVPISYNGQNSKVKTSELSGSSSAISEIGLYGPLTIYSQTDYTYLITSDDINDNITVTASTGTVTLNGNTFIYNAGAFNGSVTLTVGTKTYTLTVNPSQIAQPIITFPQNAATGIGSSITFVSSNFVMLGGSDIQKASNWQLSTDPTFQTTTQQSLNDTTNLTTWTVNNLQASTTYYARVQYIGQKGELSTYSSTVSFTTQAPTANSQIVAEIDATLPSIYFGNSISMDFDGLNIAIGAPNENNVTGAVYLYSKDTTTNIWSLNTKMTASTTTLGFGKSLSLTNTSTTYTLAIGAPDQNAAAGAVYIFSNASGSWQQDFIILPTVSGGYFGYSVSLDSSGTNLIVGAPYENNNTGAVYIYQYQNNAWNLITRLSSNIASSQFGSSVEFSGSMVAIGAITENNVGAIYIYNYNGTTWQQIQYIPSLSTYGTFGYSLSFYNNANLIIVGDPNVNNTTGSVSIYKWQTTGWAIDTVLNGENTGDSFGASLSLNYFSTTLIIGAPTYNNGSGQVYVYKYINNQWQKTSQIDIVPTSCSFGVTTSISGDAQTAAAGAIFQNASSGSVYILAP